MLLSFKQLYFDTLKMCFYDECSICFPQIVEIDFDPLYPMSKKNAEISW